MTICKQCKCSNRQRWPEKNNLCHNQNGFNGLLILFVIQFVDFVPVFLQMVHKGLLLIKPDMLISGAMTGSTRLMHSATSRLIYTWERFDAGYIDQKPFPVSAGFILFLLGLLPRRAFRWSICKRIVEAGLFRFLMFHGLFFRGEAVLAENRYVADNDFLQDIFVHLYDFFFHDCPSLSLTISSSGKFHQPAAFQLSGRRRQQRATEKARLAWVISFHNGTGQEACCRGPSDAAPS